MCRRVLDTLGFLFLASAAADGHHLIEACREDLSWIVRVELEFCGGFWILTGLQPRVMKRATLLVFIIFLVTDSISCLMLSSPRQIWGQINAGHRWVLLTDSAIILVLVLQNERQQHIPRADTYPGRVMVAALTAITVGAAVDCTHIGHFPIVSIYRASGPSPAEGLDYLIYLPEGYYRSKSRWPLLVSLHGAGAVGGDIVRIRREGLPKRIEEEGMIPFVVVAPHTPERYWDNKLLLKTIDYCCENFRIDKSKVYLTGLSLGGHGVWSLATDHPDRFAAIVPICGAGDPARAGRLRNVATWAFHGAEDREIPPDETRKMVQALISAGAEVKTTIYPGIGHDSWTLTYKNLSVYDWLLKHNINNGVD